MNQAPPLFDFELEVKALKTLLSGNENAARMLCFLKPEHLYWSTSKNLLHRIEEIVESSGETALPTWRMLLQDHKLDESIKASVEDAFDRSSEAVTTGDFDYLSKELEELSRKRKLFNRFVSASEEIRDGKSLSEITASVTDVLSEASGANDIPDISFGAGYSLSLETVFNELIYGTGVGNVIPTGFKSFDERSGGHQRGNLVIWAATSGGGKSQMALNLLVRQYLAGHTVVLASYEMNFSEILQRITAIISEVPMEAISTHRLTVEQKIKVDCAFREFNLVGMRKGNTFHIACPCGETTVSEIALKYKSYKPTTIIFDYINLLATKSKHVDAQWQMLGEIAKDAKVLAVQYNCVVHLLTQVDADLNLRYSKAIKDHANWVFAWVYDDEARANGFVTVKQLKARNAPCYDFQLLTRFDIAQFRDPDEDDKNVNYTLKDFENIQEQARSEGVLLSLPALEAQASCEVALEKPVRKKPKVLVDFGEDVI